MYFLISYLKHKKIEKLKVSGYATDEAGKKFDDTSSVYENFEDTLVNLSQKIKKDEKRNDIVIGDEVFEK